MKLCVYIPAAVCLLLAGCKKTIDLKPQSNLSSATYYSNLTEVKSGVNGAYNGLQAPLIPEWTLTELRSDNSKQGVTSSSSASNKELDDLDMFRLNSTHSRVLDYWTATYNNIRNANVILRRLGMQYDAAAGKTGFNTDFNIPGISAADRKQLAGEALFIRAYHYFNLVRLFGGVFLVDQPLEAASAKALSRSPVDAIYKFIQADLRAAADSMAATKFASIAAADKGRVTGWAAKGLLAKVLLTLNKKAEAAVLLNDIITNSGYGLETGYANVFSITNEVSREILFTIRFKAGGVGLGATFANTFAALNSGSTIVIGNGLGLNTPTFDLNNAVPVADGRKATLIGTYATTMALYPRKYISTLTVANDAENDWPVLRYADILLMLAEAQGNSAASIGLVNQVRARAGGLTALSTTLSTADFETALSSERRAEFAFENQRWFDLMRFNTTLTTITAEAVLKAHFAREYDLHYKTYPSPTPTLAELQANVTAQKLLLPIPQREIDTNTQLKIEQNPGY